MGRYGPWGPSGHGADLDVLARSLPRELAPATVK